MLIDDSEFQNVDTHCKSRKLFAPFIIFPQPESDTPVSSLHSPSFVEKRTMDGAHLLVKFLPRSLTMNFASRGKGTVLALFTRKFLDSQPSNLPLLLSFFSLFSSKTAPSSVFWSLLETATQVKLNRSFPYSCILLALENSGLWGVLIFFMSIIIILLVIAAVMLFFIR